jgi:hypothetical protein
LYFEAKIKKQAEKEEEFDDLLPGFVSKLKKDLPIEEEVKYIGIPLWEANTDIWNVYKVVRQYLKPVFAGMGGLVSEEVDTTVLFELCKVMKLRKKKVLDVVELLPYLHNTVLSRKLKREAESNDRKERVED